MARKALQALYCWTGTVEDLTVHLASTDRGACRLGLELNRSGSCSDFFRKVFPSVPILEDRRANSELWEAVNSLILGKSPQERPALDIFLTPFQQKVLETAAGIPFGSRATYQEVATALGSPGAARAVGQALGRNPVPVIFP